MMEREHRLVCAKCWDSMDIADENGVKDNSLLVIWPRGFCSYCEDKSTLVSCYSVPDNWIKIEGDRNDYYRWKYLHEELEKRFPGVVSPYSSDPPEPKLLKALDELIEENKRLKEANNG